MPTDAEIRSAYTELTGAEPQLGYYTALNEAKDKLRIIISRFGDADGDRLTAEYIAQLVHENMMAAVLEGFTMRAAELADQDKK